MKHPYFDRNKITTLPVMIQDFENQILYAASPDLREIYAKNIENIRDFCNYLLEINFKKRQTDLSEFGKSKKKR